MKDPQPAVPAASPIRVGVVGAGPWASMMHAPALASCPDTELVGIWARRLDASSELAGRYGVKPFADLDELLDACEAVAFAVPPDVQVPLAVRAAGAGKAVLLEKPIALSADDAHALADAVGEAGVPSLVTLTYRFSTGVRDFLAQTAERSPDAGRAIFVSDAFLGGPFTTPWRLEFGSLADLGPHVVDLLDAALGTIVGVHARRTSSDTTGLLFEHASGAISQATMSGRVRVEPSVFTAETYDEAGTITVDCFADLDESVHRRIMSTLAALVRDKVVSNPLDVHRGLHLATVIDAARRSL